MPYAIPVILVSPLRRGVERTTRARSTPCRLSLSSDSVSPMAEPNTADNPRSLAWVVNAVKGWVERCGAIWVQAQVIEVTRRSGPTQFLTLRDPTEEISATATCHRRVLDAAGPIE